MSQRSSKVLIDFFFFSTLIVKIIGAAYVQVLSIIIFAMVAYFSFCLQSRFLVLCICSDYGFLQRMAWETLSNLSEKVSSKI